MNTRAGGRAVDRSIAEKGTCPGLGHRCPHRLMPNTEMTLTLNVTLTLNEGMSNIPNKASSQDNKF